MLASKVNKLSFYFFFIGFGILVIYGDAGYLGEQAIILY